MDGNPSSGKTPMGNTDCPIGNTDSMEYTTLATHPVQPWSERLEDNKKAELERLARDALELCNKAFPPNKFARFNNLTG